MKIDVNIKFPIQYELDVRTGKKIAKVALETEDLNAIPEMFDEEVEMVVYMMKPVMFEKQFRTQVDFVRSK
jgi:hypothetical protein